MRQFRPLDLGVVKAHIERHAGTHEIFMDLVAAIIGRGSQEYSLIEKAAVSIVEDFRDIRRHTGEEYVIHQRSVAVIGIMYSNIRDHRKIIADLLHDTPEDVSAVSPAQSIINIREAYGRKVAHIVEGMTKPVLPQQGEMDKSSFDEVCGQIIFKHVREFGRDCMMAKCRDRLHNMMTLWGNSEKKLRKIRETLQFVLPIAIHVDYLWQELSVATAEQISRLHIDDTK
jgi:(p)ppGpp synthase/HD superfamily hydrolase